MAKPYNIPDFKKLYPETKDEIIAVLKISERKMQYQEYDLKNEQIVIDMEKQTVTVIPSREDSYERMKEADAQFRDEGPGPEEQAILRMEIKQLYRAILCLSEDDRYLIVQLLFPKGRRPMAVQYNEIQELLRSRADLHARLNLMLSVIRKFRITGEKSIIKIVFCPIN